MTVIFNLLLYFRACELVHREDLQNLEFVAMPAFFGVSSQPSVTEFRKCDASLRDIGLKAD
jgi:hypothetical protein